MGRAFLENELSRWEPFTCPHCHSDIVLLVEEISDPDFKTVKTVGKQTCPACNNTITDNLLEGQLWK